MAVFCHIEIQMQHMQCNWRRWQRLALLHDAPILLAGDHVDYRAHATDESDNASLPASLDTPT